MFYNRRMWFCSRHTKCDLLSMQVMYNTALHSEFLHDHKDYGFSVSDVKFDWRYVNERNDTIQTNSLYLHE